LFEQCYRHKLSRCVDVAVFAVYKNLRSRGASEGVGTDTRGDAFLSGVLTLIINVIFCSVSETFSADQSRDLSQKLFKA
jgi:hypothetical protein